MCDLVINDPALQPAFGLLLNHSPTPSIRLRLEAYEGTLRACIMARHHSAPLSPCVPLAVTRACLDEERISEYWRVDIFQSLVILASSSSEEHRDIARMAAGLILENLGSSPLLELHALGVLASSGEHSALIDLGRKLPLMWQAALEVNQKAKQKMFPRHAVTSGVLRIVRPSIPELPRTDEAAVSWLNDNSERMHWVHSPGYWKARGHR